MDTSLSTLKKAGVPMRRTIIAGNWKMNLTISEGQLLARSIADYMGAREEPLVILLPPNPYFSAVLHETSYSKIEVGAQNVHSGKKGAFTGELSDGMIYSVGCIYTLVGHSERRHIFKESDAFINLKMKRVIEGPLIPILCIGETLTDRENSKTESRIKQQLKQNLKGVSVENGSDLIVAYEPVWAIGTGKTAAPEQAEEMHAYIRALLSKTYGKKLADDISILYGGSVTPDNAGELLSKPDIDGLLVGGASLESSSFCAIIDAGIKNN